MEYKKLFCPGHEVNGRDDLVEKFNSYVDEFIEKNKDNGKNISHFTMIAAFEIQFIILFQISIT